MYMYTYTYTYVYVYVYASWGKTAPAFCTFLQTSTFCTLRHAHATSRPGFGVGWGWEGDVDVHVNLRHTRMLRHVLGLGLGGVGGMLTFMLTCDTRACYVTQKRVLIHTGGVDAMWRLSKISHTM